MGFVPVCGLADGNESEVPVGTCFAVLDHFWNHIVSVDLCTPANLILVSPYPLEAVLPRHRPFQAKKNLFSFLWRDTGNDTFFDINRRDCDVIRRDWMGFSDIGKF